MQKTDVLVDIFFKELPIEKRIFMVAQCGYKYIETWNGGDAALLKNMTDAGKNCGVELVSIVMNYAIEADVAPIRKENLRKFMERIDRYSDNALNAGCRQGIVTSGQSVEGRTYQEQRKSLVDALALAGELAAGKGFGLNLEPLNTEVDHPGYFLDSQKEALAVVKEVSSKNVKILYDIYHMGIMGGNLTTFLEHNIEYIGHFHCAGIPGRHELFDSEINYRFIIKKITGAGYDAYWGLEYFPLLKDEESLKETFKYLYS